MRTYRVSALASAGVRMWRGWAVIVPVVIANAVAQALLVWPAFTYGSGWLTTLTAAVSALLLLAAYGLVAVTALAVPDGRVGWAQAVAALRTNAGRYALWAVALAAVVAAGLALFTVPGLVVLAVTPFLLLAALDGRADPLAVDLRTIGRRFWRWLATVVITGLGVLLGTVVVGFTAFFWRGGLAALLVWLAGGLLGSWVTVGWALIYRSAWALQEAPEVGEQPDFASA